MAIYSVWMPPAAGDPLAEAEDAVFLKDGFSVWAFVVPLLWPLVHGLWLVFGLCLLVTIGLELLALAIGDALPAVIGFFLSLLFALEANSLRAWTLGRRGWRDAGIVAGDSRGEAEHRFFTALASGDVQPVAVAAPRKNAARPVADNADVLGLFPDPGRS